MRQVDDDELTYQIFSGLRRWTWSVRKRVFAPLHQRRDVSINIAADMVCESLRIWTFVDPAFPHECIALKQISGRFAEATSAFPGAIACLWLSNVQDRQKEAQAAAALLLAASIADLEVLSETSILHLGIQPVRFPKIEAPDLAFQPSWP